MHFVIILPMTTKKAERGYVASAFTLDPATSNKLSESLYKVLDEYTYAKNKGDAEAALVLKYLQKTKSAVRFTERTWTRCAHTSLTHKGG